MARIASVGAVVALFVAVSCNSVTQPAPAPGTKTKARHSTNPLPQSLLPELTSKATLAKALGPRYAIEKIDTSEWNDDGSPSVAVAVILDDRESAHRWAITYEVWSSPDDARSTFSAQAEVGTDAKLPATSEPNFCVFPEIGPNYCRILEGSIIVAVQRVPAPGNNSGGSLKRLSSLAGAFLNHLSGAHWD